MSRELRIGATKPASGAPAFAVSRDSAGILIGVRDKAAPQFAVSRDAEGLLLSGWPTVPPLPTYYVASGYVLGIGDTANFDMSITYFDAVSGWEGKPSAAPSTGGTTSLTDWQRVCVTAPVPANATHVSTRLDCYRSGSAVAYWTAMQMEGGAETSAYRVGGANLILNPEFTPDLSNWGFYGRDDTFYPPSVYVFSRGAGLPSSPLPGITTALKWTSNAYVSYRVLSRAIALPTP